MKQKYKDKKMPEKTRCVLEKTTAYKKTALLKINLILNQWYQTYFQLKIIL